MYDSEPMKPSNTGRLIADVLPDTTWAFLWSRTQPHPELLALLADPVWQPYVVFPACEKEPARLTGEVTLAPGKKPLFILLDGTWPEARKMFNKSPYLDGFPVLAIKPDTLSTYGMRVANSEEHLCTAEVAACVLEVAGSSRPDKRCSTGSTCSAAATWPVGSAVSPVPMRIISVRRWRPSRKRTSLQRLANWPSEGAGAWPLKLMKIRNQLAATVSLDSWSVAR